MDKTATTTASLQEELEALKAERAKLAAELEAAKLKIAAKQKISVKTGQKGGVSVYGLQRFPVTLYGSQWVRLFAEARPVIEQYIADHPETLAEKN